MLIFKIGCLLLLGSTVHSMELKALKTIVNFLNGDFLDSKAKEDDDTTTPTGSGQLKGVSFYNFIDYISFRYENYECSLYDYEIAHLKAGRPEAKAPIVVKCLPNESVNSTLLMPDTVMDIVALLKPIGNSTKRNVEGSCVLIMFYSKSCPGCARVAPIFNPLPKLFPNLKIAAIDAYKFHSFNAEFGIVGLPTILLFHQGRPIVKFYGDDWDFRKFVTRHTGLAVPTYATITSDDFRGPLPIVAEESPDYYLLLAWAFIIFCAGNYFSKSAMCKQMIEMIQRTWRESEAQLEHS
ncbi:thioredoxin domain-containing protein 15 [Episyrphus balteatus]|uniref:thioredoxin domain-containing protein 15 n=1 Tax=Episyrphus balteatus TaxID=286459 RepID=UPI0024856ACC|nr:thioredoxin domain-containing protein 15 [Episyrphus balteatus]